MSYVKQTRRQNGWTQKPQENTRRNQIVTDVVTSRIVHAFAEPRETLAEFTKNGKTTNLVIKSTEKY